MLSTNYRLRLENICNRIASHKEVSLEDIIWAEKLGKANQTAAKFLRQARRYAANPDMTEDSLDGFLNALDIGGIGHEAKGIDGSSSVDDIIDFFKRDDDEGDGNWLRRD
jgi:hypothetical protein